MRPIASAKGLLRAATPPALRRALEALAYARAPVIAPQALGGLSLHVPAGYEDHYGVDYEPDVTTALLELVRPGAHCADVGAHIGYFTLLMAGRCGPGGAVTAFEASAPNAAAVAATVRLNQLEDRVQVVHAAVGEVHGGRIALFHGRQGGDMEWSTSSEFVERNGRHMRGDARVPAVTLDSVFAGRPLDVVKIDVEGAEGAVLRGARAVLREQRPLVVLEFHRPVGWPAIGALLEAGYRLEALDKTPLPEFEGPDAVPYHLVARPV